MTVLSPLFSSLFELDLSSYRVQRCPISCAHFSRFTSHIRSDIERRPKKGDEDYIKSENAFVLFYKYCETARQPRIGSSVETVSSGFFQDHQSTVEGSVR